MLNRAVCQHCSAYIVGDPNQDDTWYERADDWLYNHACGIDTGSGIEDTRKWNEQHEVAMSKDEAPPGAGPVRSRLLYQ